jgi:cytochrome c553
VILAPTSRQRIATAIQALAVAALTVLLLYSPWAQAQDKRDAATPYFRKLDSMEARMQACVTCHGQQGQGTSDEYFPRIAGKPAAYLYNQLLAFREGRRVYPPMNYLVGYLPDAYLKEMAEYFAAQQPAFEARGAQPLSAPMAERGRTLVQQGDAAHGVPACVACHGKQLTGMLPGIPGLAGLKPAYIAGQLTRWRVGERVATEPDCMKRIATRLTDSDISAVAGWLAQQPAPGNAAPEPSNLIRMPLACGSQG